MPEKKKFKMKIHLEFDEDGYNKIHVFDEGGQAIPDVVGDCDEAVRGKTWLFDEKNCSIFFTQSSPVCVYFKLGGKYYRRCTS